jgi:hypothetical protein
MEPVRVCRSVIVDSNHVDEVRNPDPYQSEVVSGSALKWKEES